MSILSSLMGLHPMISDHFPTTPPSTPNPPPTTPVHLKFTVLVIHADSYTGHYIARTLVLDPSLQVRITARRRESIQDLEKLGCDFHPLRDIPPRPDDLDPIYSGISAVVLVPPIVSQLHEIVALHYEAIHRANPSPTGDPISIIFLSSFRANRGYPTADPWFDLERAEEIIQSGNTTTTTTTSTITTASIHPYVILQIGYVQQNFVPLAELIRARAVLPLPLGPNASVAPVNLKDVASAVRSVLLGGRRHHEAHNRTYIITGPHAVTGDDIARIASTQLGFQVNYVNVRDSVMRRILCTLPGITQTELEAYMAMYQDIRDGYHNHVSPDLSYLLPRQLTTLSEFFHDNASQFRPELCDLDDDPITSILRKRRLQFDLISL